MKTDTKTDPCNRGQGEVAFYMVAVAQLVRVPVCGSGGCGFDTHQSPKGSVAQVVEHNTEDVGVGGASPS